MGAFHLHAISDRKKFFSYLPTPFSKAASAHIYLRFESFDAENDLATCGLVRKLLLGNGSSLFSSHTVSAV